MPATRRIAVAAVLASAAIALIPAAPASANPAPSSAEPASGTIITFEPGTSPGRGEASDMYVDSQPVPDQAQ